MKRKGLKYALALALNDILGHRHALTVPNAKRYFTREYLRKYNIRDSTKLELEDWIIAVQILRVDLANYFALMCRDRKDRPPRDDRFEEILNKLSSKVVATKPSSLYV